MRSEALCSQIAVVVIVMSTSLLSLGLAHAGTGMPTSKEATVEGGGASQEDPVQWDSSLFAPPANDVCSGAIVIPDGPYPVTSAVTAGVDQATGAGDPLNSCSPPPIENGVWYKWTPAVGGAYSISSCTGVTSMR